MNQLIGMAIVGKIKLKMVLVFVFSVQLTWAQDYQNEFLMACEMDDTTKQFQILEKWETAEPKNPELYTARFNYHFANSQNELVELRTTRPKGEGLILKDSLGNSVGFMGSEMLYDSDEIKKAFSYIDKGIEQYPNRLDMRFGKIYVFGQLEDWKGFTEEIIKTIKHSYVKQTKWLWTNNKPQEEDEKFMLSAMQDYQLQLYNTGNDSLLMNMRRIAKTILESYPQHIESLSNLSITHTILGEYDKALESLFKAETLNPNDHIIVANIAHNYSLNKNKDKAIEYYEKLMTFEEEGISDFAKQQITQLKKE